MSEKTGGPAFPTTVDNYGNGMYSGDGMTLRDYFAAKAMQGLIARHDHKGTLKEYAQVSYEQADAMMEARK